MMGHYTTRATSDYCLEDSKVRNPQRVKFSNEAGIV